MEKTPDEIIDNANLAPYDSVTADQSKQTNHRNSINIFWKIFEYIFVNNIL